MAYSHLTNGSQKVEERVRYHERAPHILVQENVKPEGASKSRGALWIPPFPGNGHSTMQFSLFRSGKEDNLNNTFW